MHDNFVPSLSFSELSRFRLFRLKIGILPAKDFQIAGFVGDPFHNGFGRVLKAVSPKVAEQFYTKQQNTPKSFLIRPPVQRQFLAGIPVDFEVLLFGTATNHVDAVIEAILLWQSQGVYGRGEAQFSVQSISTISHDGQEQLIYLQGHRQFTLPEPCSLHEIAQSSLSCDSAANLLLIKTITPLCYKYQGRYQSQAPDPALLFKLIMRRLTAFEPYVSEKLTESVTAFIRCHEQPHIIPVAVNTRYTIEPRNSRSSQPIGGLFGCWSYGGEVTKILPWVAIATWLHIGAKTSFGLGQIDWSIGKISEN